MSAARTPWIVTRREFLATTGATLALASLGRSHAMERIARANLPAPAWVHDVTRMAFCGVDQFELVAKAGVQVIHTNLIWPY